MIRRKTLGHWLVFGSLLSCIYWVAAQDPVVDEAPSGDPFGSLGSEAPVGASVFSNPTQLYRGGGQIQSQAVTLQYLDAKQVAEAFTCLCISDEGRVIAQEQGNTVLIFDSAGNVPKIAEAIKAADQPQQGLVVETVNLRYLDASAAKDALEKLSSEHGSITVIERSNALVVTDTERNVRMIQKELTNLDEPTQGLEVETVNLKFLEAANLQPVLTKMLTRYGQVSTNASSNSLIVCDTKENLPRILEEIRQADKTPQQIMIEVVILDVRLTNDTEVGINWDMITHDLSTYRYRQNFTSRVQSTINDSDTVGNATVFNSTGPLGGDFSIIVGNVRNVIHLMQEKRDVEIIASPRAMVVSGKTATIRAVEEIPYRQFRDTSTGGQEAISSTEFKNVGVTLQVTATMTDDEQIYVNVQTEQNVRTGESSDNIPIVDTRQETTSLLLQDGQIVVMGGLRRQEKTKGSAQIPVLGDIPLVGWLFRHNVDIIEHSELIVLLSPHIYKGEPVDDETLAKVDTLKGRSRFSTVHKIPWKRALRP